jgi:hypothetical protein
MLRISFRALAALMLLACLLLPIGAQAHEEINFGDYTVTYGWQTEPPVAGEPNAITLTITEAAGQAKPDSGAQAPVDSAAPTVAGTLSILSPADGAQMQGDSVEVAIAFDGEHAEDLHWHLYVDDQLVTMQPIDTTTFTVTGLADGNHTLQARTADADHNEGQASATTTVHVSGSSAQGTPAAADPEEGDDHGHGTPSTVDISGFTVQITYGGQARPLTLEPVFGGEPGQYLARLTPSRAGQYTVMLGGQLGNTPVSAEIEPEEVLGPEVLAFPALDDEGASLTSRLAAAESAARTAKALAVVAIVAGLVGLGAGALALVRRGR